MTGRYHAYIVDFHGDLMVRPGIATLDKDLARDRETGLILFAIRNLTGQPAAVSFPGRNPCPKGLSRVVFVRGLRQSYIPPNRIGHLAIAPRASGFYPYEITFKPFGKRGRVVRARGESTPGMIIDP
jgi:hypothetical protein